ncbi:hypothetical protein MWU60_19190 [Yoonia sp. F2084L]|uniref:hypothetical protein n=1 Tax=Yoonia sp. F2084L TaxID=2926419 RepID=UPI001FF1D92B|nr:hypothetical protein [Yoonia sp. F2084L]MCK0097706.1 hypothetical protein [Yoonia sp. F2084L]
MTKNFIIIEPDPIVAMDVEGLLISQFPRAHITTGASLADIGPAIHNCGPTSTMVVKGTLLADDGDLRRVARIAAVRKARIVVIGGPFDFDFPATFIELPFTSDMMLAAMTPRTPELDLDPAPPA